MVTKSDAVIRGSRNECPSPVDFRVLDRVVRLFRSILDVVEGFRDLHPAPVPPQPSWKTGLTKVGDSEKSSGYFDINVNVQHNRTVLIQRRAQKRYRIENRSRE